MAFNKLDFNDTLESKNKTYYIDKTKHTSLNDTFKILVTNHNDLIEIKGNISKAKIKHSYCNNSVIAEIPNIKIKYNYEKWRIALGISKKALNVATTLYKVKNILIEELELLNVKDFNNLSIAALASASTLSFSG